MANFTELKSHEEQTSIIMSCLKATISGQRYLDNRSNTTMAIKAYLFKERIYLLLIIKSIILSKQDSP